MKNIQNTYNSAIGLGWLFLVLTAPISLYFGYQINKGFTILLIISVVAVIIIGYLLLTKGNQLKKTFKKGGDTKEQLKKIKTYSIVFGIVTLLLINPILGVFQFLITYYSYKGLQEAKEEKTQD